LLFHFSRSLSKKDRSEKNKFSALLWFANKISIFRFRKSLKEIYAKVLFAQLFSRRSFTMIP
jgi:hypothetical protein